VLLASDGTSRILNGLRQYQHTVNAYTLVFSVTKTRQLLSENQPKSDMDSMKIMADKHSTRR